jgi:hypothetical protein
MTFGLLSTTTRPQTEMHPNTGVHFNKWARGGIIEGKEKRGGQRDEEKPK